MPLINFKYVVEEVNVDDVITQSPGQPRDNGVQQVQAAGAPQVREIQYHNVRSTKLEKALLRC